MVEPLKISFFTESYKRHIKLLTANEKEFVSKTSDQSYQNWECFIHYLDNWDWVDYEPGLKTYML